MQNRTLRDRTGLNVDETRQDEDPGSLLDRIG